MAGATPKTSSPEQKVVRADDCQPGELRSGAGELWRVAIDPLRTKEEGRNYFVPVHTQLYIARKLEFNDPGRKYALPPNFQNKHKLLPQRRKAPPLPIRPLKEAQLAVSEKQLEKLCDLKTKAKKYVDEKNAFLAAKAHYTQAKCRMESLMGIFTPEKISQMQENEKIVERQIAEADAKIKEFTQARDTNNESIRQADINIGNHESKKANAMQAGDTTNAALNNTQLQTFKGYKAKLETYGLNLQQNLNLLEQAKKCLEKEFDKLQKKTLTAKETRMHYKGVEDLNQATINVNECRNRLTYLNTKLPKTNTNIEFCKGVDDPEKKVGGGFILQGGAGDDSSYLNIDGANRAVKAVMDIEKTVNAEALKKRYQVCQDNLPKLEIQKGELKELIVEAKKDLELAQTKLKKAKKDIVQYKSAREQYNGLCVSDTSQKAEAAEIREMLTECNSYSLFPKFKVENDTLTINEKSISREMEKGRFKGLLSYNAVLTINGNRQYETAPFEIKLPDSDPDRDVRIKLSIQDELVGSILGNSLVSKAIISVGGKNLFSQKLIMIEMGLFDEGEMMEGFRTYRPPDQLNKSNCVSVYVCAGEIKFVYYGECFLGLIPHGYGIALSVGEGGDREGGGDMTGQWNAGYLLYGRFGPHKGKFSSRTFRVKHTANGTDGKPTPKRTEDLTNANEAILNAEKVQKKMLEDKLLSMVHEYLFFTALNPDAKDEQKQEQRQKLANKYLGNRNAQYDKLLLGGLQPNQPNQIQSTQLEGANPIDRLYASAQRMQVLAGGGRQTARQLAEAHLQAGVLVKDISEGLEQDRIRELQLRSGPGSLGLSGGIGGISQMAHNQQVLSDFRYAAIQALRGGSHRKILGGELSDALIMHYSNPNPS